MGKGISVDVENRVSFATAGTNFLEAINVSTFDKGINQRPLIYEINMIGISSLGISPYLVVLIEYLSEDNASCNNLSILILEIGSFCLHSILIEYMKSLVGHAGMKWVRVVLIIPQHLLSIVDCCKVIIHVEFVLW